MDLEKQELRKKHRRARKMMLLFSLLSITMTFAGLTSAYIVSKARPDWLTDFQLPNYFFISTVIIIISSLSMWLAKTNVKKNNFSKTSLWLGVTFLLSLFFIFSQFAGYQELINDGYYFTGAQSTVTTSFLYVLSLLHLAHVLAGVIVLIVVIINNKKMKYKDETLGFELAETFWHFLGFLWLYLFVFLYFFR